MGEKDKQSVLKTALSIIEKKYGKGSIMSLGEKPPAKVEVIPSGALTLDIALGIGGFPKGRVTEIFGQESSGKTTLALHAIAEAQKRGGIAAFIDAEHALDPEYASKIGVDIKNLYISQPDYGEQALDIAETLVRSGAVDIIVIDSVAALVPKQELEEGTGFQGIGMQARLMSQALRRLVGTINQSKTCVIFINQVRMQISTGFSPGGLQETTPGGRALKFYSTIRVSLWRGSSIKGPGDEPVGYVVHAKVVKNKLAAPYKSAHFEIIYSKGIDREGCIVDLATQIGLIEKSGTWYRMEGKTLAQGREKMKELLRENPQLAEELEKKIRAHYEIS